MDKNNRSEFRQKIRQLERETTAYLNEIKELISKDKQAQNMTVISYFTYSSSISHDSEKESLIIGTYHIHNLGNKPITNPYICIKLSPDSPFMFSGKYISKKTKIPLNAPDAWERMTEQTDKSEYWLRPIGIETIEPDQLLSFPNFQVKWLPKEPYSGSIRGFTYFDEQKEGISAINQINISGT